MSSAPSGGRKAGTGADGAEAPVLLCCAGEDRFALAPAIERLAREGVDVDIVSGVEYDPTRLAAAIERHRNQALYVLCRSDRLDRFKLTRLQLLLKREGLSDEHVLPVKLLAERPESVSNPVLERIRQAPSTSRPSKPPLPPKSPVNEADPDDDAATVPVRLRDIMEAEAPAPTPASPPPAPAQKPPAAAPPRPAPTPPPTPSPVTAPVTSAVAPMPAPAPDDGAFDDELAAFGQRKRLPMILGGIGALGLLVVAAVMVLSGDDETAASEQVADAEPTPPVEETEPEPEPAPEPAPQIDAETGAPETGAPETGAPDDVVPEPEPDSEPAPAPADAPPPPEPGTFALTPAEEHAAMMEALRSRRVRAFDLIVYVPKVSRYGNVARAEKYCAQMEIEGLEGWRLPAASELRALLEADLIKRSRYWTNQSISAKKHVMIEGRSRRAAVKKTTYKGGRALCVRDETRGEADAGSEAGE